MKLVQRIVLGYYRRKFKAISIFSKQLAAQSAFNLFCTPYSRKKDEATPIFQKAEPLSLRIEDDKVSGFRWKPDVPANGNTILICHGFDSCSYRFSDYIGELLHNGFEVLAFDAPAHGSSQGKTITILKYVEMIERIHELYGPVHGIMAHSFGGLSVVLALEKMKDNICKRLVIIAPSTETTFAIEKFMEYLHIGNGIRQEFYNLIEKLGGQPASWFSAARAIEHISIPTMWIHDKEDNITPYEHMHHLTQKDYPHISFEITEGLGHSPYRDAAVKEKVITYFLTMI